jgi:tetratricopeptide (TPR) repeat protein
MLNFLLSFIPSYNSHHAAYQMSSSYLDATNNWLTKLNELLKDMNSKGLHEHLSTFDSVKLSGEKVANIRKYIVDDKGLRNKPNLISRTIEMGDNLDGVNRRLQANQELGQEAASLRSDLIGFREQLSNQNLPLVRLCIGIETYLMKIGAILIKIADETVYSNENFKEFAQYNLKESSLRNCIIHFEDNMPSGDLSASNLAEGIQIDHKATEVCFLIERFDDKLVNQVTSNSRLCREVENLVQEINSLREDIGITDSIAYIGFIMITLLIVTGSAAVAINLKNHGEIQQTGQEQCDPKGIPNSRPKDSKALKKTAENCLKDLNNKEKIKIAMQYLKQLKKDNNNDLLSFFMHDYSRNLVKDENEYEESIKALDELNGVQALNTIDKQHFDAVIALAYIQSRKEQVRDDKKVQNDTKVEGFYDAILKRDPGNIGARFGKCNSHFSKKNADLISENQAACKKLVADLEKTVENNEDSRNNNSSDNIDRQISQAYSSLGCVLMRLGKYKDASQIFANATRRNIPNNENASSNLRLAYFYSLILNKDYIEAEKYYGKLRENQEMYGDFNFGMGITYFGLGSKIDVDYPERQSRFSKAKEYLKAAGDTEFIQNYFKSAEKCAKDPSLPVCHELLQSKKLVKYMHQKFIAYVAHPEMNGLVQKALDDYESKRKKSENNLSISRACDLVEDYER